MLSSGSQKGNVTKWALMSVILVVMCGAALVWKREEAPQPAIRIAKSSVGSQVALPSQVADEFERFDANGDGVIDKREFVAALSAKSGMPMAVLRMAKFDSRLDALYEHVLHATKPKDVVEKDSVKQGITKGHVARMLRDYGLKLSYDRHTLHSLLRSFLNHPLEARPDATSSQSTLTPEQLAAFGLLQYELSKNPKKTEEELLAERGTLKRNARCDKTAEYCGGYSCGKSDHAVVKYACCKKPQAVGKFAPKHSQCGCCTTERDNCVWDGSLIEKRNGLTRLDSVIVGDEVHVGNGEFDVVIYVEHASMVDMVSIEVGVTDGMWTNTTELRVTYNHMVVKPDGEQVMAGHLKNGDEVGCDMPNKTCVVMGVFTNGKGSARSIFLRGSNHFIANGIMTSSFTDSPRVMDALLSLIINPVRWIWLTTNMSREHPLFFLVEGANRVFSWTIDPLVRSRAMRHIAYDKFGLMAYTS